jgi:hypothetical protein
MVSCQKGDEEACKFAEEFVSVFVEAGWAFEPCM